jgi:hypothetical protein
MIVDGLTLIAEFWREIGIKLFVKPQDRTVLRNRTYAGLSVMVAAQGLDLALPTAGMPPAELAPLRQDNYAWSKWGQHYETKGGSGEECDVPAALRLRGTLPRLDGYRERRHAGEDLARNAPQPRRQSMVDRDGRGRAAARRRETRDPQRARACHLFVGADRHARGLPPGRVLLGQIDRA